MIAIIVADQFEVRALPFLRLESLKHGRLEITKYESPLGIIAVIHSGIGLVNAAVAAHYAAAQLHAKIIYNYGASGGQKPLQVGSVVMPRRIYLLDAATPWYEDGVVPGEAKHYTNAAARLSPYDLASSSAFINKVPPFKGDHHIALYDMEAAAIMQVAHQFNIKAVIIKGISDLVDAPELSHEALNHHIKLAASNAFEALLARLK